MPEIFDKFTTVSLRLICIYKVQMYMKMEYLVLHSSCFCKY